MPAYPHRVVVDYHDLVVYLNRLGFSATRPGYPGWIVEAQRNLVGTADEVLAMADHARITFPFRIHYARATGVFTLEAVPKQTVWESKRPRNTKGG